MSEANAFDVSQASFELQSNERVIIFATEWHSDIVNILVEDAVKTLQAQGVTDIEVFRVPGCYELPQAVSMYLNLYEIVPRDSGGMTQHPTGIICFGCVVQGETPHFTFISDACANNLERVACDYGVIPMMFGVLTTNTVEQARARADGTHSRKGVEVAISLLKMLEFKRKIA